MIRQFDQQAIAAIIPHRYENMLLDHVEIDDNPDAISGEALFDFSDIVGTQRDIFFLDCGGKSILMAPFFMELLALSSIACVGIPDGQNAFFASISQFKFYRDIVAGETIRSRVVERSRKGGISASKGTLLDSSGQVLAEGNMSAAFVDKTVSTNVSPDSVDGKKVLPLPDLTYREAVDKALFSKRADMCILDYVHSRDSSKDQFVTSYTYPEDHPLIKGHFPNNPVMMGVMQWMGIEDACLVLLAKQARAAGEWVVTGNGLIQKANGVVVAEVKRFRVVVQLRSETLSSVARVHETFKVVFRDFVQPGSTLIIHLTDLAVV